MKPVFFLDFGPKRVSQGRGAFAGPVPLHVWTRGCFRGRVQAAFGWLPMHDAWVLWCVRVCSSATDYLVRGRARRWWWP